MNDQENDTIVKSVLMSQLFIELLF